MDEHGPDGAFLSTLTTEHFVSQSVSSTTVSEASSRASLYLMTLSSSLVAIGFVSQSPSVAGAFVAAVVPVVFLIGVFTTVRVVDTGVENILAQRTIARVRQQYAAIGPDARAFFGPPPSDISTEAVSMIGARPGRFLLLFTMASMIGAVNAAVGGVAATLVLIGIGAVTVVLALSVGVVVTLVLFVLVIVYQRGRYRAMDVADRAQWRDR
jgi:hypothetical protein